MSKKLQKNGLWESSRMMLPQHKEALLNRRLNPDKPAEPARPAPPPKREELELMKNYVMLSHLQTMVTKKIREIERSSETLKPLYAQAAQVLAQHIDRDLSKAGRAMLDKNIHLFPGEHDGQAITYPYTCRGHEGSFLITREYMRADMSKRLGIYTNHLVAALRRSSIRA
ncbi:hypothetical protein HFN20_23920 [Paenibacillus dendritiformis]|uniref:hypothetical protein n=1 Tax=Paenibacillus dendritiformis TaxID=130049 RepID=UPI00143D6C7C|nr:hypothetical protein [Paenibacillus dendritiformis]NKI24223.1 hypothetical protein [Paenibacillus dendritiformis]NRG01552.1 hypothetical protein [Paenibacillus dendritiformis]